MADPQTTEDLLKGFSTEGPICPCCDAKWVLDEAFYYDENGYALRCDECDATFSVQPVATWSWTSRLLVKKDDHDT